MTLISSLTRKVPWWTRIPAKIVLSRLPVGYTMWQRLGLFRHGKMDDSEYALGVLQAHLERGGKGCDWVAGRTILEMGPGDSIATAIAVDAMGGQAILVDTGRFASRAPHSYGPLRDALRARGLEPLDPARFDSLDAVIEACGARYLTNGREAWRQLASDSVDMIFSQAVLEHVALGDFEATLRECHRILAPGAFASHRVDLQDHLGGALNNLRFRDAIWESEFFRRSGFYTNRIQMHDMRRHIEDAGFVIEGCWEQRWQALPTPRSRLAKRFRDLPDEILNVRGFDILTTKPL